MKRTIGIIIILSAFLLASPAGLLADDIDIYGGMEISVKPNVLIIFDTSGSMGTEDVYSEAYDPALDYSSYGSYTKDAVYYGDSGSWYWLTGDVEDVRCDSARQELKAKGYTTWRLKSNLGCRYDTSRERYRTGNYRNYLKSPMGAMVSRTSVAKQVIVDLIDSVDNVNLGLMRFNNEHGGRIEKPVGTNKTEMKAAVNALPASGWTPLAETLAEAGLYFAGKKSWFNDVNGDAKDFTENGIQYTSPMEYSCQKNYIILMTDGESTKDKSNPLWKKEDKYKYIKGDWIGGDYDSDGTDCSDYEADGTCKGPNTLDSDGTDFLDDVAKYLYDNDLNATLGDVGTDFEKQNLTIFTIGFKTDFNLLVDTATNGGGQYFTAEKAADLKEAFESIISWIFEDSAVFVAPVVPVNRMNRTFAGDRLFLGFFRPKTGGLWSGNLKKYKLSSTGDMLDQNLIAATDSFGRIVTTSQSFWSTTVDGPDVEKGGAGEQLLIRPVASPRTIYTIAGIKAKALSHPDNNFSTTNAQITPTTLAVSTEAEKDAVINRVRGVDRGWMLGDIIHSEPTVVHYWTIDSDKVANGGNNDGLPQDDEMESYVFVGANDGMLHAFRDSDGSEQWGFVPPDLLPTLKLLMDSDTDHDYYVDGPPVAYERWDDDGDGVIEPNEVKNLLFFGERRGGDYYYALDISNPTAPLYKYIVKPNHLRDAADKDGVDDPVHTDADLGQSWVKPEKHTIFVENDPTTASDDDIVDVLLMGGGYDENQDFEPPAATDDVGRAVFAIQVDDTDGNSNADVKYLNYNGANYSDMTHCIIDISGFDRDANGYLDTVYAGDLGGHIFAFRDLEPGENPLNSNRPYAYDGVWEKRKLFELPTSPVTLGGQSVSLGLKFMYSPDLVTEYFTDPSVSGGFTYGDFLFIGTGDRTHPGSTDFTDALYAIKNLWTPLDTPFTTVTISDLYDATDNLVQVGTAEEQEAALSALEDANNKGWFIRMTNDGEKVVSSPRVYAGVVYFTTYEPPSGVVSGTDPCAVPTERGTARVYALNYKTGAAAIDFTEDGSLTTSDRSLIVGTSIPSAPVITVMQDGVKIFVGVQGGVKSLVPKASKDIKMYYWRQVF
ncbi:MAG: hypothetical protein LJE89_01675 [Deltaproteobacteria bacterium]|nr:hypothetical protein [Deltaproteobacteria bacterium]